MSLKEYRRKRKFAQTPEPRGKEKASARVVKPLRFVVQMHAATRLHFDLRLEMNGVFKSWAVPKGPSLNPMDQRLAVFVEDHPLEYGSFEGVIPRGNYGAGTVMLWDEGHYVERGSTGRKDSERAMLEGLEKGHMTFVLEGHKLNGEFALVRLKKDDKVWLLVKKRDAAATYKRTALPALSVKSDRSIEQIARESQARGDVWNVAAKRSENAGSKTAPAPKKKLPPPTAKKIVADLKPATTPAAFPRTLRLALPVNTLEAPWDGTWLYTSLHAEGLRALCEVGLGRARFLSRTRLPLRNIDAKLTRAFQKVTDRLILDGEIHNGIFWVFDLMFANGQDLRLQPLEDRLKKLANLKIFSGPIKLAKSLTKIPAASDAPVLARLADSTYRGGVQKEWRRFVVSSAAPKKTSSKLPAPAVQLSNLDKVYWPQEGYTKGDVVEYYRQVAPLILPHLKDRPQSMNRHPDGIAKKGFFQKDLSGYYPRWIQTQRIYSESAERSVNYLVCQNTDTLLYMANLGCIELNPWLSTLDDLERPTFCVIDLDPGEQTFPEVIKIALSVREVLESAGVKAFCKTSGGRGLHIVVPLGRKVDFDTSRVFAETVGRIVQSKHPKNTTLERSPGARKGKLYIDCLQNRRSQTLAAVYSLRPRAGAPVSTPLEWSELQPKLRPEQFHIGNALKRFEKKGDLWLPTLREESNIARALAKLQKIYKLGT